jgi:chorismate synthase
MPIVDNDHARAATVTYRDLSRLDDFTAVVALEREIWGPDYDEAVPPGVLKVSTSRGAILIGAFDEDETLVGFVYSLCATKNGHATQWSHKLGVAGRCRNASVGRRLKLLQRERALAMGVDLIEWTFDPLQATNAHLNIAKLGTVVEAYEDEFYGATTVPVRHRHHPTDRFVTAWYLRLPRVTDRLVASPGSGRTDPRRVLRGAVAANRAVSCGEWPECRDIALDLAAPAVAVEIPTTFGDMLARAPERALAWRLATRHIFGHYFALGYRAVEFALDLEQRKGTYVLKHAHAAPAPQETHA